MRTLLLAEFRHAHALRAAVESAARQGWRPVDAFTPIPVEGLSELLPVPASRVRVWMFWGGVLVAAAMYATEYYSAVINYPYNSGGRPPHSWPAFMLAPFAIGIFGAAVAGFIRFLLETGLPRLHFPLFWLEGFERASQDGFFLAVEAPESDDERRRAAGWLREQGTTVVREVRP